MATESGPRYNEAGSSFKMVEAYPNIPDVTTHNLRLRIKWIWDWLDDLPMHWDFEDCWASASGGGGGSCEGEVGGSLFGHGLRVDELTVPAEHLAWVKIEQKGVKMKVPPGREIEAVNTTMAHCEEGQVEGRASKELCDRPRKRVRRQAAAVYA